MISVGRAYSTRGERELKIKMNRLYKAYSNVPMKHYGKLFNNVSLNWYVENRTNPVMPYEQLIVRYEDRKRMQGKDIFYDHEYVNELFTYEEIEALRAYLTKEIEVTIKEVPLPIEWADIYYPHGGVPCGGGIDNILLYKNPDYNLPFKAVAYFDLRQYDEYYQR